MAHAALSPTRWQASTFPANFQPKIRVIHDGIDTDVLQPNPQAQFTLGNQHTLTRQDEVVTFVNRNLEPYRGYHVFMRCLPALLQQRPRAQVVLVGGDEVSHGHGRGHCVQRHPACGGGHGAPGQRPLGAFF
jgi:glycosyltransferase involved in cell wall biosynthesis